MILTKRRAILATHRWKSPPTRHLPIGRNETLPPQLRQTADAKAQLVAQTDEAKTPTDQGLRVANR